jgi:hypothetical protein
MTHLQLVIGISQIITALVLIGVSLPLVWRKIPMNRWYGIRIPKAFKSEELWYDINAYGGKQLVIWSVPMVVAGIAFLFVPIDPYSQPALLPVIMTGPMVVFPMIAIVVTLIYAARR